MSGLDPLALAAQAAANAQAAIDQAILNLGADAAILQAQVNVGDVIAATVLPPQSGSDLLSFLGQTVQAQIPAGIDPGQTLLLQVTGFTNSAVIVRNLGIQDPENPVPTVNPQLPPQPQGATQRATLVTITPLQPAPQQTASQQSASQQSASQQPAPVPIQQSIVEPAGLAPPREVFVAASVTQNPPAAVPASPHIEAELADDTSSSDVEARIGLARATPQAPPAPQASQSAKQPQQSSAATVRPALAIPVPGRLPVAPPIVRPAATPVQDDDTHPAPPPAGAPAMQPTVSRSAVASGPQESLLARLRVPVTPATLAAARSVTVAAQTMTAAYDRLESTLAKFAPESSALRSMLAFVARFDLRNVRTLPEQIATYVSDVVDGAEAKIVQIVSAWAQLAREPDSPATLVSPALPGGSDETTAAAQNAGVIQTTVAAQTAERAAAMEYDVKTAILAMIADPSRTGSPAIAGALRDALTATTAVQLSVLSAQSSDSRSISIPLPAYFYEGGLPVQMQISRDAPQGRSAMDADNFHIAFVLDTKSLGTVAIDLQTVGRAVSVDVKTEAALHADRFRSTLGDLRSRLEQLHYRVASIVAGVAAPAQSATEKPVAAAPPQPRSLWDTRA